MCVVSRDDWELSDVVSRDDWDISDVSCASSKDKERTHSSTFGATLKMF